MSPMTRAECQVSNAQGEWAAPALVTIVICWAVQTKLVPTGRIVERNHNYFPEMTLAWEGKAAVWLSEGTAEDLAKAT